MATKNDITGLKVSAWCGVLLGTAAAAEVSVAIAKLLA